MLVLVSSCLCHLYVYSVAHTHTRNISKTLQSHHASMQRLNSICGLKTPNQANQRETLMVYNGVGAGIDTCLLYTGRPSGPSSSANNLNTNQTLNVVTPRKYHLSLNPLYCCTLYISRGFSHIYNCYPPLTVLSSPLTLTMR